MSMVYDSPDSVAIPQFDYSKQEESRQAEKQYIEAVQQWARERSRDKNAGEIIAIPYADGRAVYVVLSTKPVKLIHLAMGDAWDAPLAHRLTPGDVVSLIQAQKALDELFKSKPV